MLFYPIKREKAEVGGKEIHRIVWIDIESNCKRMKFKRDN